MSYFPSVAFLTGSVGAGEWIVLFVVVLIVVGPKRLPEIARKIGRTMEMFRRAADEFKDQIMSMDQEPPVATPSSPVAASDVDGVPASGAGAEGESSSGSYEDAYPNMSDYPGNEDQVDNWSADSLPGSPAESVPEPSAENAGEAVEPHVSDAAAEKPAEDGA